MHLEYWKIYSNHLLTSNRTVSHYYLIGFKVTKLINKYDIIDNKLPFIRICDAEALALGPVRKSKKPIFNDEEDEIDLEFTLFIVFRIDLLRIIDGIPR